MPVSTFIQPDPSTQSVDQYLGNIGGDISVMARVAAAFAPHESAPAAMTVTIDAGSAFNGTTPTEIAAQTTSTIVAPTTNPRIDRIVVNRLSGALSVVTGTESATPTPPAIPAGAVPIARVQLTSATTAIVNASISDERAFLPIGTLNSGVLLNIQRFTASGTYTPTPGTNSVIVEVQGAGGGGGGSAAPTASQGSAAGGGGSGAFASARLLTGFTGVTVTVGAGGAATAAGANPGNAGGESSFGSLVVAPGGTGGPAGVAVTAPSSTFRGGGSALPTGGNLINRAGMTGDIGIVLKSNNAVGGLGGPSALAAGAVGSANFSGGTPTNYGPGGGGGSSYGGSAAQAGGGGGPGVVFVYEYA